MIALGLPELEFFLTRLYPRAQVISVGNVARDALERLARGVRIEQPHLRDGRCPDKAGIFVKLRAGFHAATARDAAGERVGRLLLFWRNARASAEVVTAVDRDPRLHSLEILEDHVAIGRQIAHNGELRKRFQPDRLLQVIRSRTLPGQTRASGPMGCAIPSGAITMLRRAECSSAMSATKLGKK